jgi:hypothetical protein
MISSINIETKNIYIPIYIVMTLMITHCGPAQFSGQSAQVRDSGPETQNELPLIPDDLLPPDEPPGPDEEPRDNESMSYKVYDIILADNDFSIEGQSQVQISIPAQGNQETFVFIHAVGTPAIQLVGDTSHIVAVFLTNHYQHRAIVTMENGDLFPESHIATGIRSTGFTMEYTMGEGVRQLLPQELVNLWLAGTEYSFFATQVGDKSCHSLSYRSSQPQDQVLSLNSSTSYVCLW